MKLAPARGGRVTECVEETVTIRDGASLSALRSSWDTLLQRTYNPDFFLTSTWMNAWCDHFRPSEVSLLTTGEGDELSGVLPLQILTRENRRVLTLLGDPEVMDYMDALADRERADSILHLLWERALNDLRWDTVELRHVPSGSPLLSVTAEVLESRGHQVQIEHDEVDPVVALPDSWDAYLQTLSKKQRHEIRRKLRRAEIDGDCSWRTARTPQDLDHDLPVFFRLHQASARDKAGFMDAGMRAFFSTLAVTFLERGELRLSVFRRDGIDIAATMSFLWRDRLLLYNSGYDPEFAPFSPGIAAVAKTIQDAIRDGATVFDFLSGDEPYKYQFGASNKFTKRLVA